MQVEHEVKPNMTNQLFRLHGQHERLERADADRPVQRVDDFRRISSKPEDQSATYPVRNDGWRLSTAIADHGWPECCFGTISVDGASGLQVSSER
jgi:hypothetical protein